MAFFHNRTVNLLNLHYVISSIASGGGGAFYGVYLLKAGVPVWGALLSLSVLFASRLVIRIFLLPMAIRIGLRWTVFVGAIAMGTTYVFLAEVTGVDWSLFWLVFVSAAADCIYWPSYHAYFAALGDEEHRGQQLGIREGVTALVGVVSPLVAAWLLVNYGPRAAFYSTGAIQALSAIPILWTPDIAVAPSKPGAYRAALSGAMLFVSDGVVAAGYFITWQIALFLSLGQDLMAYGGALAIAALVGAVGGLFLGRLIDTGGGGRAVWYSVGLLAMVIAMRAAVLHNPALAITANALGALVGCLYVPTIMTAVYNQAKRSPCVMRFHIAAEGGWDVGVSTGLAVAAAIVWAGYPIAWAILLSMGGATSVFFLLQRYYAANPFVVVDTALVQPEDAKI
ncbi:MAG TPA: MFS transporter [Rhizomicrobium sp.]|nr:MFS transporter [Rhizomicrobium sp.]